jgi:cobalt-zinc-cadmium efflux system outer membrane protein
VHWAEETEEDAAMKRKRSIHGLLLAVVWFALSNGVIAYAEGGDARHDKDAALRQLIEEALARNPEIQAARQQWEAATQRVPQARALDDPNLQVQWWNAPESFNLGKAENTIIGLSQKFPFPGKLALQGEVANRTALVTEQALRAKERDLIARVKQTYNELFFAHQAIQIHHEEIELLKQFVVIATAKFRTGKGSQVDVFKAQVELADLHQRLPVLEQRRDTAQASVNTLVDRDPRFPIESPAAPTERRWDNDLEELFKLATTARPELKAAELAVQRNEQSRALANRQYYPDLNVAVQRFQNFQARDGFGAVMSINLPFSFWTKPKYDAAVQEAAASVAAARADLHTLANMTRFQIRDLLAKVRASGEVMVLYRTTVLPEAEQGVKAAQAGYRTGKTDFLNLIEAARALRGFRLAYYRALVDRESRLAELEQVVGSEL